MSKIQYFSESFYFKTGRKLGKKELEEYLKSEKERAEYNLIDQAFNNMSLESIKQALDIVKSWPK